MRDGMEFLTLLLQTGSLILSSHPRLRLAGQGAPVHLSRFDTCILKPIVQCLALVRLFELSVKVGAPGFCLGETFQEIREQQQAFRLGLQEVYVELWWMRI